MQPITWVSSFIDPRRRLRRVRRRLTGCCLLVVLSALLVCAGLLYMTYRAGAQGPETRPLEVMLLIDNSNSMWEKGGIGSDPELLRIEAARLFITYLGVDSSGPAHRLGVVFFGGQAQLVVPLTPMADDHRRGEIFQLIANPPRMGWTDPQAALELAAEAWQAGDTLSSTGRAVVLLTDGKPERRDAPTAQEKADTIARLRETSGRFAADGIPLFIILLQNAATDADPEIEEIFVPLWQEMAEATSPGHFYRARQSGDLLDIYHDIVVSLTGRQTAGVVLQAQVETETREQVSIEAGLAQVTFVARKSSPALQVTILRPDGRPLAADNPGVQYAGRPGQSREEVWAVHDPPPGDWQVHISGRGSVTVWKDFYPAPSTPIPSPSPTDTPWATPSPPPTASLTPQPIPTPVPTPGPLPRLTLSEPTAPATLRPGDLLSVAATWLPGARILAYLESAEGERLHETRLSEMGEGHYTAQLTPSTPGYYRLRLYGEVRLANGLTIRDEADLPVAVRSRQAWWWIGLLIAVLGAGGGGLGYRRWRSAPLLDGTLRRLAGPPGREVPVRLDLDARHCRAISLGPDPAADVHLPHAPESPTPRARLVAQRTADGVTNVMLAAEAAAENSEVVLVNGLPLSHEHRLQDGDSIQLGAYRFRYENLRRRASDQWRGHAEDEWRMTDGE
jgi:hypothetical protein